MPGRHHLPVLPRQLPRWVYPLVAAVIAIGLLGAYVVGRGSHPRAGSNAVASCSRRPALNVIASPSIAPAVQAAATNWSSGTGSADGPQLGRNCLIVHVSAQPDAAAESAIVSAAVGAQLWIPSDTVWAQRLTADLAEAGVSGLASVAAPSIATSPLVIVGPPSGAVTTVATQLVPTADRLAQLSLPNPTSNAEGLLGLAMLRALLPASAPSSTPNLIGLMVALGRHAITDASAGFARAGSPSAGPFVASEQAVIAAAAAGRTVGVSYPDGPDPVLDFPVVALNGPGVDPSVSSAATSFVRFLGSVGVQQIFGRYGLRDPSGDPIATAGRPGSVPIQAAPAPSANQTAELLRMWSAAVEDSHTLVVIDVSGSMADPAGNGSSKIEVAAKAAADAAGYFPDSSSFGLWAFSSGKAGGLPWRQLAPLVPLGSSVAGGTQRQALLAAAGRLPGLVGGDTALYDTALAAFEQVRNTYDPAKVNTVVLLTDGQNEYPSGLDLPGLLTKLRSLADPSRPVPIITIGVGSQADVATLQQISAATGGKAYSVRNPADIRGVFLDAILARECRPNCG